MSRLHRDWHPAQCCNISLACPMPKIALPPAATPADLPGEVRFQIVSHCAEPPAGDGWRHEVKHDGHRLVAIVAGARPQPVSRNGYNRTELFASRSMP